MATNFYDAVVLGEDLTGLITATLCARRGLRVLCAQPADAAPDAYTVGPFTLPRAPFPFFMESPAVRRVLTELNFVQSAKRRLQSPRPAFQIVLPTARLDVSGDLDALRRELEREFPKEAPVLDAFVQRAQEVSRVLDTVLGQSISVPPEGFWEKRELRYSETKLAQFAEDPLPGLPEDHPARLVAALPAALTSYADPRELSPVAVARGFDAWRRGGGLLSGGRDAFRQMLAQKLRTQHAGELQTLAPEKIETRWSRCQTLRAAGGRGELGASVFVAGEPVAEFGDLFGAKRPKKVQALEKAVRPATS